MYQCKICGKRFRGGLRVDNTVLWEEYVSGRRTVAELALAHRLSERTVRRRLALVAESFVPYIPKEAVVIADTTYFGRGFGVMIFLDAKSGAVLHRMYVRNETNDLYRHGMELIRSRGTEIKAFVCDGRTGLLASITECPVQMCQFHMLQIVRRKLTNSPRLTCGRELLGLCRHMFTMGRKEFLAGFDGWCSRWDKFLPERTKLVSGKTTYTHRRLRSARKSIKAHLGWLFTSEDFPSLGIPPTTNQIEGVNSRLKKVLRAHNGMSETNRKKVIDAFLNTLKNDRHQPAHKMSDTNKLP